METNTDMSEKMRYAGAIINVESYVIKDYTLIYLETIGSENMVKAVTSVIMQGNTTQNKHTIDASFGSFSINKSGNKRKMIPLQNGLAHSILYHSPSIVDTDFSVIIGRDEEELKSQFKKYMEMVNFLPYPPSILNELFYKLQEKNYLKKLDSFNLIAYEVSQELLENEGEKFQEIILEVSLANGIIKSIAKPQAPLPKSPILTDLKVKDIWDTLNSMPKTYELEDLEIKPIGLKLFSPNMTIYVVEADRGSEDDEFANMHTQCYGYVVNESAPECSEWGYVNIREYIEVGNGAYYFEKDMYFNDMYIDSKGNIFSKEKLY